MKTIVKRLAWVAGLVFPLAVLQPAPASAENVTGFISGVEVALQNDHHGAIFLFSFWGTLDGKFSTGWGVIEVKYTSPLPAVGDATDITGEDGVAWIRRTTLDIDVIGGELTGLGRRSGSKAYRFGVAASLDVNDTAHAFHGTLSHLTFPPTIFGWIAPVPSP